MLSFSPYSFRMGSEILAREDLENIMTLGFFQDSVLFFTWHTTFANFRRSLCKRFAANCTSH